MNNHLDLPSPTSVRKSFNAPQESFNASNYVDTPEPSDVKPHKSRYTLPGLMRAIGAITLIASVSIYLFQGLGHGSDISRYVLLLIHTIGLATVGMFCSRFLHEQKSARLLLMLTLVFISANFAIIGAFLYSIWGAPVADLNSVVVWVTAGAGNNLWILASAAVVLAPLALFGFKVIARRSAARFASLFILANLFLLVPSRNDLFIGVLAVIMLVLMVMQIIKARVRDASLASKEGLIARAILFVPLVILLSRNMMHSVGEVIPLIISASLYLGLRQCALTLNNNSSYRSLIEVLSLIPALAVAITSTALVSVVFNASVTLMLFVFSGVLGGLLLELSMRSEKAQHFYSALGALIMSVCMAINVIFIDSGLAMLLSFTTGVALAVFGVFFRRRLALFLGGLLSVIALGYSAVLIFGSIAINNWFSLAVIGVLAIVAASLLEKHGQALARLVTTWRTQFQAWNY